MATLPAGKVLATITSPAPQYFAMSSFDGITTVIDWYTTSNAVVASYTDRNPPLYYVDQYFIGFGTFVYWMRSALDGAGNVTGVALYDINFSNLVRAHLAGAMTATMMIGDANAQSVLITDSSNNNLYRVPLPLGPGNSVPALMLSTSVNAVTEDANGIYWIDSGGTMYGCSPTNCRGTKKILTNGQAVVGRLYQDASALYWGTKGPSQVVRLAK
jgi:hypothetical protein